MIKTEGHARDLSPYEKLFAATVKLAVKDMRSHARPMVRAEAARFLWDVAPSVASMVIDSDVKQYGPDAYGEPIATVKQLARRQRELHQHQLQSQRSES